MCTSLCAQALLYNQTQPAGGDLPAGTFKRDVLYFGLMGQFAAADNEFTAVTVKNIAAQPVGVSDIVTIQLWLDDGDGLFQNGTDKLIASKATGTFPCTFDDFSEPQTLSEGLTKRYFVSVDVSSTTTTDLHLKLTISASDVAVKTGSVSLDGATVEGNNFKTVNNAVPVIALTTQPTGATAGQNLGTMPILELRNAAGTKLNDNITEVTVSVTPGSGKGGIGPTSKLTVKAVAGVVTFSGLMIDQAGTDYQLTFTAANFASATSDKFDITTPAPVAKPQPEEEDSGFFGCAATTGSSNWILLLAFGALVAVWRRKSLAG
jgi:hypothetical protein